MKLRHVLLTLGILCLGVGPRKVWADPAAYTECTAVASPVFRDAGQSEVEFYFNITNNSYSVINPDADLSWVAIYSPEGVTIQGAGADVSGGNFNLYPNQVEFSITEGSFPRGNTETFRVVVATGIDTAYSSDFMIKAMSRYDEGSEVSCPFTTEALPTVTPVPTATVTPVPSSTPSGFILQATSTPKPTATPTPLPTPTPTPIPDTTLPRVAWITEQTAPAKEPSELTVQAKDEGGVYSMDYSTDDGGHWLPMTAFEGKGTKNAKAVFTPDIELDDSYQIRVRASDKAGNVGLSEALTMVIDRLPPLMVPGLMAFNSQVLTPTSGGIVHAMVGVAYQIVVTSIGGADEVTVDVSKARESYQNVPLTKTQIRGVFVGAINFKATGMYDLTAHSVDGAGNKAQVDLYQVLVQSVSTITLGGVDLSGATVQAHRYQAGIGVFQPFRPSIETDAVEGGTVTGAGDFSLWLPSGDYYLRVMIPGWGTVRSAIFTQNTSGFLAATLKPTKSWKFLPQWLQPKSLTMEFDVSGNEETLSLSQVNGAELPAIPLVTSNGLINVKELAGGQVRLLLSTPWMPSWEENVGTIQKLDEAGEEAYLVVVNEEYNKVSQLLNNGGYTGIKFGVDPTGELARSLKVKGLPVWVKTIRGMSGYSLEYGSVYQ